MPRIVSLLPGLTDLIIELGRGEEIVGQSHECDGGERERCCILTKSKMVKTVMEEEEERDISASWGMLMNQPTECELSELTCAYYQVDLHKLQKTMPDIILTILPTPKTQLDPTKQEIICALQTNIPTLREVHDIDPITISEIFAAVKLVTTALQLPKSIADKAISNCKARIEHAQPKFLTRIQRIAVIQWADPIWLAGAWVPEAVTYAGGDSMFTRPGGPSIMCSAQKISCCDIVVFAICGFDLSSCRKSARRFIDTHHSLFRNTTRFIVTDGNTLFSRATLTSLSKTVEVLTDIIQQSNKYQYCGKLWNELTPIQSQQQLEPATIACHN